MLVELNSLKPNPMRDFAVDPMDDEAIDRLRVSIEEDGFWGGVVCRQRNGDIQIAAGHHRVAAAIKAGIREADLFVANGELDDAAMIRIYARENATQRGNVGTAQAGSVAAAVRFIAKAVLGGVSVEFNRNHDFDKIRGNLTSDKGMGREIIVDFLEGVPGINPTTVQQALANIKSSGDYGRIIGEVQAEIERENREALEALKEAEAEQARIQAEREEAERKQKAAEAARKKAAAEAKAAREETERQKAREAAKQAELDRQRADAEAKLAEKRRKEAAEKMKEFEGLKKTRDSAAKAAETSAARPKTFDFEGVARHLKNSHQIDVFRQQVTGQGIAPYLPVANQAALAEHLVKLAKDRKAELSGAFIRENVVNLVLNVKQDERQLDKEEQERLRHHEKSQQLKLYFENIGGALRTIASNGEKINRLLNDWPKGEPIPIQANTRNIIGTALKVIQVLYSRI